MVLIRLSLLSKMKYEDLGFDYTTYLLELTPIEVYTEPVNILELCFAKEKSQQSLSRNFPSF